MTPEKVLRGFASPKMADKRQEISQKGGRAVPKDRRAFAKNPELAKAAGRKGGQRRREANAHELQLLREFADGSTANVPNEASGRTLRKVDRLVRLGYFAEVADGEPGCRSYIVTQAGYAYLRATSPQ